MNETMKTLLNRRSIRGYKPEQIKDEDLKTIIEAGKYAPSAVNQQSWHFTVIQNKEMLNKINSACKNMFEKSENPDFQKRAQAEGFSIFYNAPTYIIVSGDDHAIASTNDGSLALGNMFNAACSLGIGSCWIHAVKQLFAAEEGKPLKKELGIPEGYSPIGSAAFGYSAGEWPSPAPRKEGTVTIIK